MIDWPSGQAVTGATGAMSIETEAKTRLNSLPIKVRIPVARGDGAYAYVRYEGIRNLSDNQLLLTTGEPLDCLQSKRSLQEAMARAHALQSVLKSEEACRNAERKLLRLEMLEAKKILKDLTK